MTLGCFTHCPASWHPFPLFWQGPGWVGWFGTMGWLVFMVGVGKVPSVGDSFFVLQENSKFSWKLFLLCSLHYHIAKEPFFFSFFFFPPSEAVLLEDHTLYHVPGASHGVCSRSFLQSCSGVSSLPCWLPAIIVLHPTWEGRNWSMWNNFRKSKGRNRNHSAVTWFILHPGEGQHFSVGSQCLSSDENLKKKNSLRNKKLKQYVSFFP